MIVRSEYKPYLACVETVDAKAVITVYDLCVNDTLLQAVVVVAM